PVSPPTPLRVLTSSPTRLSSDLGNGARTRTRHRAPLYEAHGARVAELGRPDDRATPDDRLGVLLARSHHRRGRSGRRVERPGDRDRKSTRLNSSHVSTSYAGFCL